MIVLVTLFYILTYNSFKNLLGWPASESLPDRFRLVAAQIYEPNAFINSEGAIYLWVTNMNDLAGLGVPRSFTIKYNKELHEKISKSLVNLKNGVPQMGENLEENKKGIVSSVQKRKNFNCCKYKIKFF